MCLVDGKVYSFYTVAIAVQTSYMVEGSSPDCFPGGTRGSPENPYSQTVDTQNNPLSSNSQLLPLWVVQGTPLRITGLQSAVSPPPREEIKHHCRGATILEEAVQALDTNLYMDPFYHLQAKKATCVYTCRDRAS